jgi:hypothetical protein
MLLFHVSLRRGPPTCPPPPSLQRPAGLLDSAGRPWRPPPRRCATRGEVVDGDSALTGGDDAIADVAGADGNDSVGPDDGDDGGTALPNGGDEGAACAPAPTAGDVDACAVVDVTAAV